MGRNDQNLEWVYSLVGVFCIVLAIILIILFLLQGDKKVMNTGGDIDVVESMTCNGEGKLYPFFNYDGSKGKSLKINIIFDDGKLDVITLVTKLYYDDEEQIKNSSAENHVAMNKSFYADSMGMDSLDLHFSSLNDAMQMTLYVEAKDLNGINAKYFLINRAEGYTKEMLIENYKQQGLNCVIREKE